MCLELSFNNFSIFWSPEDALWVDLAQDPKKVVSRGAWVKLILSFDIYIFKIFFEKLKSQLEQTKITSASEYSEVLIVAFILFLFLHQLSHEQ